MLLEALAPQGGPDKAPWLQARQHPSLELQDNLSHLTCQIVRGAPSPKGRFYYCLRRGPVKGWEDR